MGLMDAFNAEDRITLKVSDYGKLVKEAAKADLMMNAVICEVPYTYIRETMTGKREEHKDELVVPIGKVADLITEVLDDILDEMEGEDDEPICSDSNAEKRCESESREGECRQEDGCDEDRRSEVSELEG
jgi:hypothetical protein